MCHCMEKQRDAALQGKRGMASDRLLPDYHAIDMAPFVWQNDPGPRHHDNVQGRSVCNLSSAGWTVMATH